MTNGIPTKANNSKNYEEEDKVVVTRDSILVFQCIGIGDALVVEGRGVIHGVLCAGLAHSWRQVYFCHKARSVVFIIFLEPFSTD